MTKPFANGELLARVRALLRKRSIAPSDASEILSGPMRTDLAAHKVTLKGKVIHLTRKEFAVLALLARHAGRLVAHTLAKMRCDDNLTILKQKSHFLRDVCLQFLRVFRTSCAPWAIDDMQLTKGNR